MLLRGGSALTEVGLVGAAFKSNSFLRALDQEVPHQLVGQVAPCGGAGSTLETFTDSGERASPGPEIKDGAYPFCSAAKQTEEAWPPSWPARTPPGTSGCP